MGAGWERIQLQGHRFLSAERGHPGEHCKTTIISVPNPTQPTSLAEEGGRFSRLKQK
jgi:hypothetical protein